VCILESMCSDDLKITQIIPVYNHDQKNGAQIISLSILLTINKVFDILLYS